MKFIGDRIENFCLPDQNNNRTCMDHHNGKWKVIYFYPKDDTKGCIMEALDFNHHRETFESMNAEVIGISPDPADSHEKFSRKHGLKIKLLSDADKSVSKKFGVWQKKKMYGEDLMGVQRSTFLVDPEGKIAFMWPKVAVPGHVAEVIGKLSELV